MRNLLAFVAAAILTFVCVGWYLDWYRVKSSPAPSGHQQLNIDLNRAKIAEDVHKGVQRGEEKLQDVLEKGQSAEKGKPPIAGPPKSGPSPGVPK
jgi:hypothetical protein